MQQFTLQHVPAAIKLRISTGQLSTGDEKSNDTHACPDAVIIPHQSRHRIPFQNIIPIPMPKIILLYSNRALWDSSECEEALYRWC